MEEKRFIEHLEDLRGAILKSLIGLASGIAISFAFVPYLFRALAKPYRDCLASVGETAALALRSLGPADTLHITLKAAFIFGLGLSSPWIAYQAWRFVSPALHRHEKRYAAAFCSSAAAFFLAGAAFAYVLVLPAALSFFYRYTKGLGVVPDWAIANYYEFTIAFLVGFGLVFELPIAILVLTLLGMTSAKALASHRRHAIVGIFIAAAIFTPGPDVASQLMMAAPMVVLYELSILGAKIVERRRRVNNEAETR